ncbi:MAG: hypothetical protein GF383_00690 [Candidatus Lokiarchaeota archaeon]|nr:hypothetical protein [Candidatus Lokiarchaeota archaeon]MBD3337690.1 hypothetical protein [Candidatus Lokiarchaeota archaeon]
MTEKRNKTDDNEDLRNYLKEIEELKTDFSDLDDLDIEEIKEMQEAIESVKKGESFTEESNIHEGVTEPEFAREIDEIEEAPEIEKVKDEDRSDEFEQKEELMSDFSEYAKIDLDELIEMKQAIEEVKQEEYAETQSVGGTSTTESETSKLEEKVMLELKKKKEEEKEEIITKEKLVKYFKEKRDKIWYHALNYLAYEVEDHTASKEILYDMLKEVTSKSAIDPIPENQFYFGLGYLLRLTLQEKKIIRYLSGSKFKINVNIENLKKIIEEAGPPISTRPVIEDDKKKKMFKDFLNEDFSDI